MDREDRQPGNHDERVGEDVGERPEEHFEEHSEEHFEEHSEERAPRRAPVSSRIPAPRARSGASDPGSLPDPAPGRPQPTAPIPNKAPRAAGDALRARLHELTPRAWVTTAIVLVNVLVFGAMVASGVPATPPGTEKAALAYVETMREWGAAYGPLTADGEPWRLLTPMFLHFGVVHLGFNMWVLWDAGKVVERLYGNRTFLAMYLLAGLGGALASLVWAPGVTSAGASGAVFGVLGALIAFRRHGDAPLQSEWLAKIKRSGLMFVLANVLYGFGQPGIDHAAHFGGFVTGFVLGKMLVRPLRQGSALQDTQAERTWSAVLAMAAITTVVLYDVGRRLPDLLEPTETPGESRVEPLFEHASELLGEQDWPGAEEAFTTVLEHDAERADAYLGRAQARFHQGKLGGAAQDADEFTRLEPLSEMGPQIQALIRDARMRRGDDLEPR